MVRRTRKPPRGKGKKKPFNVIATKKQTDINNNDKAQKQSCGKAEDKPANNNKPWKRLLRGKPAEAATDNDKVQKQSRDITDEQPLNPGRTVNGRVPQGRTLSTNDKYLSGASTGSQKERPVVVIEANEDNDLAVVPLSSREGKNRTRLKNYQQGQSFFKHYVEIEDDEGKHIRVGDKFRENHPNMDVSDEDVEKIRDKVFYHSHPAEGNRKKMDKFHKKE